MAKQLACCFSGPITEGRGRGIVGVLLSGVSQDNLRGASQNQSLRAGVEGL